MTAGAWVWTEPERWASMPPEVRENERKLAACAAPHEFVHVPPQPGERPTRALFECAKCGGRVRGVRVRWYFLGLQHGRRAAG